MGADQLRWYQFGMKLRRQNGDCSTDLTDQCQRVDHPQASIPTPSAHRRTAADCDGAMVARSQIVVSGSTAMLLGTMTNETGFDVCFSGMPPYAVTFDTDGSEPILLGDFNSPPREQPSSGDWVIHPGASVPYRSLPVTLQTQTLNGTGRIGARPRSTPRWTSRTEVKGKCPPSRSSTNDSRFDPVVHSVSLIRFTRHRARATSTV